MFFFLLVLLRKKLGKGLWNGLPPPVNKKKKPNKRPMGHIANLSINRHKNQYQKENYGKCSLTDPVF